MIHSQKILNNRYQLQRQLSHTVDRQTWLAQNLESQELVVIKLLQYSPQLQWDTLKLFEREAKVLQQLKHPRIPQYYDYFILEQNEADLPWFGLVQEYIPGQSLAQLLAAGQKFTFKQVKSYAIQILEILVYLHELSPPVLHRDIKPSNLILGKHEKIYLVDFGAVQDKAAAEGVTFTVVGTGGYAPPEQFWGKAVPASDLYALGATLIHLLTGIPPADLPQHNLRLQFAHKINLDLTGMEWLEKLIEPALEQRFKTAREVLELIQQRKPIQSQKLQQKPRHSYSISYGRLGFLSLLQLLTIGMAGAIFLPSLITPSFESQSNLAREKIVSINQAQKTYYLQRKTLTDSLEDLGTLKNQSKNYHYSIVKTEREVFTYAIPQNIHLKTYIGGVYLISDSSQKGKKIPQSILCESIENGPLPLLHLRKKHGILHCPPGTQQIK
jgi:serine/threonine protein kinase